MSVLVLTKNEESNIAACLECLRFSDDVVVFDSLSDDRTTEVARGFSNTRVVERPFDNWSSHQNWAVSNIEFRHPWVLYVDADERIDADFAAEIMAAADPKAAESAFRMRRKDFFQGTWLKRAQLYPTWFVRLFRPEKIRYERLVNPVAHVDGPTGELRGHIMHYPFSKGLVHWFERHNSYSTFEAQELIKVLAGKRRPVRGVFSRDPSVRRATLKDIFFRLPFRPQIKWAYYIFWRRAFLDGQAGMTYARLQAIYESMITFKVRELQRQERGESI